MKTYKKTNKYLNIHFGFKSPNIKNKRTFKYLNFKILFLELFIVVFSNKNIGYQQITKNSP